MKLGCERGVSVIVGEVLLVTIATLIMGALAWTVISNITPSVRDVELEVRLENAWNAEPPSTCDNIKVILFHYGGDDLGIPKGSDEEFRVQGGHIGLSSWDNTIPLDNWSFSEPADGFQLGENAVGYLQYSNANISIGDEIWIAVTDLWSDTLIFRETLTVENSCIYS